MSATHPARFAVHATMLALIAMLLPACALPPSTTSPRPARSYGVITAKEISATGVPTSYEAVALLRPRFLKIAGAISSSEPAVYLDGNLLGGVVELQRIPSDMVQQIIFLSPIDATATYGTSRFAGAVLVTTKAWQDR